jgi:1A family penicillin-binding protein
VTGVTDRRATGGVHSGMLRPSCTSLRASRPTARAVGLGVAFGLLAALRAAPAGAQAGRAPVEPWDLVPLPQATLVLGRDGRMLGTLGAARRVSVPLASLPRHVGQAFVAVEDKRFYQHDGVDLVGVAAAIKDAATSGDVRGASTITQLLVGNMHPELIDRRDRSLSRKLREQAAARELEKRHGKAEILEAFLNVIPFGRGLHGVELAARQYFGKPAAQLSVAEAASLAAMPKSPVLYDPIREPARNRARRDLVLALMQEQGYLTAAQAAAARREPLRTVRDDGTDGAAWVLDVVRVQAQRAGVPVLDGGFTVHTTIDPALQRASARALAAAASELEARPGWPHGRCPAGARRERACLEGAVVVVDPWTGDVRALVGGRDHAASSFNRAVDGNRQPGSAFKPFVYAAAIAAGMTASTTVADTAIVLPLPEGGTYAPTNADGQFLGPLPMREALARSRNPVAVELALAVGLDSVQATARRAGLRAPIAPYPSSALGASVVQPLNFVAAFAPFTNGGQAVTTRVIERIVDRSGRPVHEVPAVAPARALDPRVAFVVRDMMRDAVEQGTGVAARRALPAGIPLAGKTGTTNDNADVWFVGVTPDLVAGAWLGFDVPRPITSGAAGGAIAAPIVGRVLAAAAPSRGGTTWAPPAGVVAAVLDRATGAPADATVPGERRYTEWFLDGTEPGAAAAWPWTLFRLGRIGP